MRTTSSSSSCSVHDVTVWFVVVSSRGYSSPVGWRSYPARRQVTEVCQSVDEVRLEEMWTWPWTPTKVSIHCFFTDIPTLVHGQLATVVGKGSRAVISRSDSDKCVTQLVSEMTLLSASWAFGKLACQQVYLLPPHTHIFVCCLMGAQSCSISRPNDLQRHQVWVYHLLIFTLVASIALRIKHLVSCLCLSVCHVLAAKIPKMTHQGRQPTWPAYISALLSEGRYRFSGAYVVLLCFSYIYHIIVFIVYWVLFSFFSC